MSANEQQIGGNHYKTEYEHWDLVLSTGMDYLAGCATKYVSRWRKKNGIEDLRKALHYLNKLQENMDLIMHRTVPLWHKRYAEVKRFAEINKLTRTEANFCGHLVEWVDSVQPALVLDCARQELFELMDQAENPVPLTEENHYSERANAERKS